MDLNPPMISYFFQHPWALGLPLALCATLIILDRRSAGLVRYISLALLLAALSFSQAVVFAALAGAIPVAEVFSDLSFARRRVTGVAAAVVVALLVGRAAGGFFLPPPDGMGLSISLQAGVAATLIDTIVWHILTYGLLLPLGACGFFFLPRGRLFLALLLAGSLGVLNLLRYAHSLGPGQVRHGGGPCPVDRDQRDGRAGLRSSTSPAGRYPGPAAARGRHGRWPGVPAPLCS